jgi:hypothetical protein
MSVRSVMLRSVQYTGRVDMNGLRPAFVLLDKWLGRDEDPILTAVQPGSRTAGDDRLTDPHRLSHQVLTSLAHGIDHLHAFRSLVVKAEELHLYAPFSLMRGALENACTALWLLHPDDEATRAQRCLQLAAADVKHGEEARALTGERDAAGAERLARRRNRIGDLAEAAGLRRDVIATAPGRARIVRESAAATTFDGDTLELVWRTCSGLAHGQQWATLGMLERESVVDADGDPDVVRLQLSASGDSLVLMTKTITLLIDRAWRLYDRHRLAWRTHRRPESSSRGR